MANELDEITGPTSIEGHDIKVITKQLPTTIGVGSLIFEIALWTVGTSEGTGNYRYAVHIPTTVYSDTTIL